MKLYHNVVAKKESIEKRQASGEEYTRILEETKNTIEANKNLSCTDIERMKESYYTKGREDIPLHPFTSDTYI